MAYQSLSEYMQESADVVRATGTPEMSATLEKAAELCVAALKADKAILVCGNGGSAADAMHIAGELIARYLKERKGFNCICLSSNAAMLTAWVNDYDFESVFARQVQTFGAKGAALIAISTSGNSKNVIQAVMQAKEMDMNVIGLTGNGGGKLAGMCDALLDVPSKFTPMIQQGHTCLYHYLCERIEALMCA